MRFRVVNNVNGFAGLHVRERRRRIGRFGELVFNTVNFGNGERIVSRPEIDGIENDHVEKSRKAVADASREEAEDRIDPLVSSFGATDTHIRVKLGDCLDAGPVFTGVVRVSDAAGKRKSGKSRSDDCEFLFQNVSVFIGLDVGEQKN